MGNKNRLWTEFRIGFKTGLRSYFTPLTALLRWIRKEGGYIQHCQDIYKENS